MLNDERRERQVGRVSAVNRVDPVRRVGPVSPARPAGQAGPAGQARPARHASQAFSRAPTSTLLPEKPEKFFRHRKDRSPIFPKTHFFRGCHPGGWVKKWSRKCKKILARHANQGEGGRARKLNTFC